MRVLAGRYELGEQLGRGGMARVVRAHDTLLDRPVAVKLLSDAPDDEARERFLREARSSARLRHPSAVAVYDTGEEGDQPYIVMELIEGRSLADLLRDRGQLDVEEAIGITASVLDALGAAHAAGMIHRDVKPANVLLPDEGGVKLSDFGIAKAMDDASEGLTATGSVLGTPSYLAPELIEGSRASPASDLYSVGCLLYAQLAGRPPFRGAPLTVAYAHRHEPVPPIAAERPDLPDEVVAVLDRALDKDPERRFADAASMRAALLGGPLGEPTDAGATVAMAAVSPTGGPGEATQVLPGATPHDAAAEPTRAMHAGGDPTGGDPAGAAPARSRRGRGPLVALIALLVVALAVWFVLGREGADDPTDEPPEDVVEDPDEPDEPTPDEPPADEPSTETPEDQAPEEPEPEEPEPEEPEPEEPEPEEPAPEEPEPEDPEPEEPDDPEPPEDTDPGDGDEGGPPGQDATRGGPPDGTPGQGVPGGGSADAAASGGAAPPGEQAAPARG